MIKLRLLAPLAVVTLLIAGCSDSGSNSGSGGTSGGSGDLKIAITEPAEGATVSTPFTLKLSSGSPLGPSASGKHHVHVFFDDNESEYIIGESDQIQIDRAPTGTHMLKVSLRNANHSAAGSEASITVTIGGAGASPAATPSSSGYGY
jgi:hypothetical protein